MAEPWLNLCFFSRLVISGHDKFTLSRACSLSDFKNLTHFDGKHCPCKEPALAALGQSSPGIQYLRILWNGKTAFPDINPFPHLKTLLLSIIPRSRQTIPRVRRPTSPSNLEILTIIRATEDSLTEVHALGLSKLRTLHLQHALARPRLVFHFVHAHATLIEVNVSFASNTGLLPLTLLATGSDAWKDVPVDPLDLLDSSIHFPPPPIAMPICWFALPVRRFAFSRVPVTLRDTTVHRAITSMALEIQGFLYAHVDDLSAFSHLRSLTVYCEEHRPYPSFAFLVVREISLLTYSAR